MFYSSEIDTVQLNDYVERAVEFFQEHEGAIAVRGLSGVTIGAILAHKLERSLYIVRKDDNHHSYKDVECIEGRSGDDRQVWILDDFIDSGETVDIIYQALEKFGMHIQGVTLYQTCSLLKEVKMRDGVKIPVVKM